MGVLPLQFIHGTNALSLGLNGTEVYSIIGLSEAIQPGQNVTLEIKRASGEVQKLAVKLRIDTPIEIDYYRHGGILPFVLRELLGRKR
jgi:aconitate hydratase